MMSNQRFLGQEATCIDMAVPAASMKGTSDVVIDSAICRLPGNARLPSTS